MIIRFSQFGNINQKRKEQFVFLSAISFYQYIVWYPVWWYLFYQDFPEVASHQDSLPEFLGFMNQSSNIANLKDQSRLSMSPVICGVNKRHSCPPVPMHLQRRSPAKNVSPINKVYSPIIHGHRGSPYHGNHGMNVVFNNVIFIMDLMVLWFTVLCWELHLWANLL